MRCRNYCFTLFVEEEKDYAAAYLPGNHLQFCVWQLERTAENNLLHLQGYVEFDVALRMDAAKERLGSNAIHLEPRVGTRDQAIAYCRKPDSRVLGP